MENENNKIREFLKMALTFILVIPLMAIFYLLFPIVKIRIGILNYIRVGHLVANTEMWLRSRFNKDIKGREWNIFISGSPSANGQVLKMIKRRIFVIENMMVFRIIKLIEIYFRNLPCWIDMTDSGVNRFKLWNTVPPQMHFTEEERTRGEEILRFQGLLNEDEYVCFYAREKTYLDALVKMGVKHDWSYHEYRDSDINNYIPAVSALTSKGIKALRMGAIVKKPMQTDDPNIIDYATKYRSAFADVYLMSHCKFCLGDTAGIYILSAAFSVPCARVNTVPLSHMLPCKYDLFIPKKYWHIEDKRFLKFNEIINLGADQWLFAQEFETAGLELIENTPDEIRDLAIEMNARIDGTWITKDDDNELQRQYHDLFENHFMAGFPSRIGAEFLRQNKDLLMTKESRSKVST